MIEHYISYENLVVAREGITWAKYSGVATVTTSLFSIAAVVIAGVTAFYAKRAVHSWKEQEKQQQKIRLLRAVFSYRATVERASRFINEDSKLQIHEALFVQLADIFHELVLSGIDQPEHEQAKLFEKLFEQHGIFFESGNNWAALLDSATALQQSVRTLID